MSYLGVQGDRIRNELQACMGIPCWLSGTVAKAKYRLHSGSL